MKCPYRTKIITVKPEQVQLNTPDGKITITSIEHTDYEECYGKICPFYSDTEEYINPICTKVENEKGADF